MSGSYTESALNCLCQADEDIALICEMAAKQGRFPWLELAEAGNCKLTVTGFKKMTSAGF